jgi:hypothetical protein
MAAATLPEPGTKFGPCITCQHRDCAETRAMAAHPCRLCGQPIGYNTRFYQDPTSADPHVLVHARCLEDEANAEAKLK